MKHLTAKIMTTLACAVILLHAVVPHHHHDCVGEGGFVFETELTCHCDCDHDGDYDHDDCDHRHSHHPFDTCKLAEMLSHLVLSTKEDEAMLATCVKADVHDLFVLIAPLAQTELSLMEVTAERRFSDGGDFRLPQAPALGLHPLRGPPAVA